MGVTLFGAFMVVLDTTVVNLGLPSLQRDFDTVEGIEWVVTAYLAAVGVTQMCTGWASDRFGRKRSFVFALGLFTVASALCAAAPSLELLVIARILQGIGGGLLMPVGMAMIYELFEPDERGKALGYFGIAVMAAPAIGPVLGGSLVSSLGWRWLFLINLPVGLVGVPLAMRLLRDTGYREARPLDRAGLALGGLGLAALMIGLSRAGEAGWTRPEVPVLLVAAVVLLALFVRHGLRVSQPLVDLRIFANPVFAIGMAVIGMMAMAQYTRLVYIPLELGTLRGIGEFRIGLIMLPSALCMALTMPIGGRTVDRIGGRVPVTIGVTVLGLSFVGLAMLRIDSPLWMVSGLLALGGLGSGLSMMAPNIQAMNAVKASQVSQASGLSNVSRQVSAAIGTAVVASLFATFRPDDGATGAEALEPYRLVFLVAVGLLAGAVVVAQFLPGREKALALQAERRAESSTGGDAARVEPVHADLA
ncbi:MAG: MDR family MFS transporter [Actinomycetota bacterium]|nr:MDR family MFS transporter [Actinomycetota bacterium]